MGVKNQLSQDGETLTIFVAGRFDFSVHQEFRSAYEEYDQPPKHIVIDFTETSYLDSSALGMLLLLRDYAGGDAADIKIIGANQEVRKILSIANFDQLFAIQ